MNTMILPADQAGVELAIQKISNGELVVLPTETVYGIAADARNDNAVKTIFTAKGRPQDNPLIVHIGSMAQLKGIAKEVPERAQKLAKAFWPGPLTMIMPKGAAICNSVTAGLDTVAVRMPSHPVVQQYFELGGVPFAAPSANLSGSPSPTNAADVFADMQGRLPLILDGGDCQVGVESTVVSVISDHVMILRPGYVTKEQMEMVLDEDVLLNHAITEKLKDGEVARSPGMKYKHYAPKADVTILRGNFEQFVNYVAKHSSKDVWCLCFEGEQETLPVSCVTFGKFDDGASQAHELFSALRTLDEKGAKVVYARCPEMTGVSLAVYNRLIRAAAYRVIEL